MFSSLFFSGYYATATACLVPLGLAVASGPILGLLGFTSAGIAGGSTAAWLMSLAGGNVASGSLVAILQSWGAAGVGAGVYGAAGAMVTSCLAIYFPSLLSKYSSEPGCETSDDFVCFFNDDYGGTAGYPPKVPKGHRLKPVELYPDGKKVSIEELYGTSLHTECDLQH